MAAAMKSRETGGVVQCGQRSVGPHARLCGARAASNATEGSRGCRASRTRQASTSLHAVHQAALAPAAGGCGRQGARQLGAAGSPRAERAAAGNQRLEPLPSTFTPICNEAAAQAAALTSCPTRYPPPALLPPSCPDPRCHLTHRYSRSPVDCRNMRPLRTRFSLKPTLHGTVGGAVQARQVG